MEKTGLIARVTDAATRIDEGRKGLRTDGDEHEGRITYEAGLSIAMKAFQEAPSMRDAETLILVEYTFLAQELEFCDAADAQAIASLTQAVQSFDDAFLDLKAVSSPAYWGAEQAIPHRKDHRVHGMPKDAYHIACIAHRTRINNVLRAPGINMTEKALLQ
ncbi:MAG: hypothetical protein LBS82_03940 [Spirochaetaceae bacterium]|jgi:hypothetical protein|nr:hypothetical protein [Spirochaetaceae bacterium]